MQTATFDQATPKGRIIASAFRLAAEKPWSEVAMLDIADAAGVTLAEMRREFPSKPTIVSAFSRAIDDVVLSAPHKRQPDMPPRDALFEVIMSRFDALLPYKSALRSIVGTGLPDMALMQRLFATQAWMLNAAGVPLDGVGGTVRVFGLASLYASVFRTGSTTTTPARPAPWPPSTAACAAAKARSPPSTASAARSPACSRC
jgi:ubiquinone biosynthesis protein COQ9